MSPFTYSLNESQKHYTKVRYERLLLLLYNSFYNELSRIGKPSERKQINGSTQMENEEWFVNMHRGNLQGEESISEEFKVQYCGWTKYHWVNFIVLGFDNFILYEFHKF